MNLLKTPTGYRLADIEVDSKPFSKLPTQQARTLLFVAQGLPQKRIAKEMGIKVATVKKTCNDLSFKFNTNSMRETVHQAIKQGVLRYTLAIAMCLIGLANQELERSYRTARSTRTTRNVRNRRLRELQNEFLTA